jgi:hypothetical protein
MHGGDQRVAVLTDLALEVLHHGRRADRHLAEVDPAAGAVDRDDLALLDGHTVHSERPAGRADLDRVGAADARLAHAPGDHRGVRGLAAA